MGEPTLYDLARGQDVLVERVQNLKTDLDEKHKQNRNSIHEINGKMDNLTNQLWLIKIKIASWSAGAGVLTGTLIKLIDHFWKT